MWVNSHFAENDHRLYDFKGVLYGKGRNPISRMKITQSFYRNFPIYMTICWGSGDCPPFRNIIFLSPNAPTIVRPHPPRLEENYPSDLRGGQKILGKRQAQNVKKTKKLARSGAIYSAAQFTYR